MAKYARHAGATSNILQVFIQDSTSTTGAGLTGLVFNSGSLTAYYHRDTDTTATAITLVTMTVGTFTSSGFKEIDATNMPGWYQFCPPDAALASGAKSVAFHLKGAASMAPLPIEVDLDAQVDVYQWLTTAVTAATAGIPDVNTKNINNVSTSSVTTINANLGQTQPVNFTGTGGSALIKSDMVDIAGSAVSTSTAQIGVNAVQINAVSTSSVTTVNANVGTTQPVNFTGTGASALVKVDVIDIAGTASAGTAGYVGIDWGHINAPTSTVNLSGTTVGTVTTVTNQLTAAAIATGVWQDATSGDFTVASSIGKSLYTSGVVPGGSGGLFIAGTNAATTITTSLTTTFTGNLTGSVGSVASAGITRASFAADTGLQTARSNTAQAGGATSITLDASASAVDDFYKNAVVVLTGGTGAIQFRLITGYVGSTKVATISPAWATNPDNTSTFAIVSGAELPGTSATDVNVVSWLGSTPNTLISGRVDANTQSTAAGLTFNLTGNLIGDVTGNVDGSVLGNVTGSVGSVTAAVTLQAKDSPAAFTGTAITGASTTITLQTALGTNDLVKGNQIKITSGTGAGQTRTITGYVNSTKIATVDWAWTVTPDNTSVYAILYTDSPKLDSSLNVSGGVFTANVTQWNGTAVAGSLPPDQVFIRSGTAQAGGASTITLDSGASATNNLYQNEIIQIYSGTGAGQSNIIASYVGSTKVATVTTAWVTNPDNTSKFLILPFGAVTASISTPVTVGGYSAGQDPATLVLDVAAASHNTAGTIGAKINTAGGYTVPTVAQIATGVWQDSTGSDFTTANSIGKSLYTSGVVPGGSGGLFIAGTNAATTITTSLTTTFTGNLTGSVGSVTGNVGGNVVGSVGSVVGNVGGNLIGNVNGNVVGNVNGNVVGSVGSVVGNVGGNVVGSVGSIASGGITTASFAAGAINAAAIADAAIDRATFAADTGLQTARSNTVASAGATSVTLDVGASSVNSFYDGAWVYITSNTGFGQWRLITAYNGTTKVATITPAWITQPDATSTYAIVPSGFSPGSATAGDANVISWLGSTPNALIGGRVDATVGAYQSGQAPLQPTVAGRTLDVTANGNAGIDWNNIDNPTATQGLTGTTISSAQVVASVTGNVGGNVTGSVGSVLGNVGGNVVGSVGSVVGNVGGNLGGNVVGSIGSLATQAKTDVGAAVLDVSAAAHNTPGTIGAAINTSASASDPWATNLPGAYIAGQAGFIVGTNLDATITSRLAASAVPTNFTSLAITGAGAVAVDGTSAMAEAYAAVGQPFTLAQALYEICQVMTQFSITADIITAFQRDGSTVAATYQLDSTTDPTSRARLT